MKNTPAGQKAEHECSATKLKRNPAGTCSGQMPVWGQNTYPQRSVHMQFLNQSLSRGITPLIRAATLLEKVAGHIFWTFWLSMCTCFDMPLVSVTSYRTLIQGKYSKDNMLCPMHCNFTPACSGPQVQQAEGSGDSRDKAPTVLLGLKNDQSVLC